MQKTEYNLGITNVLLMYNESEIYEDSEGEYSYIMLALAGASTSYQPSEIMGVALVDGIIKIDMGINVPECANAEVLDALMLIKVDSSFVGKDADSIEFNFINVR